MTEYAWGIHAFFYKMTERDQQTQLGNPELIYKHWQKSIIGLRDQLE